ncbi:MAG: phosphate signaling complex protein PhoU [Gammaproteobacteria bacterium]|nr:phosphate signaling complex protein PhoU [Gammaproteobacteria bacterium]
MTGSKQGGSHGDGHGRGRGYNRGDHGEGHIFRRFDSEMAHLHALVVRMAELAVSQLRAAVGTLERRDVAAARQVVENDKKLNDLDVEADDEIVRIIALRQPMAGDLREIIAVSKIVAELERAGDEARKIAGLTIRFYADLADSGRGKTPPADAILRDIYALAAQVESMLSAVIAAFGGPRDLNLDEALEVLGKGLKLDDQLQSILRRLTGLVVEDPGHAAHFVDIVLGIRALERFGGHAKNIAGHLVFIKHGIDVRHEGVASILRQLKQQNQDSPETSEP